MAKIEWITWLGGDCPIDPEAMIEVRFRDGSIDKMEAIYWRWTHDGEEDDIVAYREIGQ